MIETDEEDAPRRVLFVDDDESLLAGLRRMLHQRSPGCAILFAPTASAALEVVANTAIDAVFSDMRMPGMDGAELLSLVRDIAPGAARIVVSGQTSQDAALRAASVAHRFLDKPVPAAELTAAVLQILDSRSYLTAAHIRSAVGALDALPSPAETRRRLDVAVHGTDIAELIPAVGADVGVMSKVMQLASTAFFSAPASLSSAVEAYAHLGLENLGALFDSGALAPPVPKPELEETATRLARHTERVAQLAEQIAGTFRGSLRASCLLHDVGVLAHACIDSPAGTTPSSLGSYLMRLWGIPADIIETVDAAHSRSRVTHVADPAVRAAARALDIADRLDAEQSLPPGHEHACGEDDRELDAWRDAAVRLWEENP